MFEPVRGGTRGGQAEFKWSDVSQDKDRENYLGHSINAPTGRWQKNKDVHWYQREAHQDEEARLEEIRQIKEAEAEALAAALGFATGTKPGTSAAAVAGPATGANAVAVPRTNITSPSAPSSTQKDADKEERRKRKAERKEEKRARKEEKKRRRAVEESEDGHHQRRNVHHSKSRSRSRSPARHNREVISRRPRSRSPHSRESRAYNDIERERERERDRRRWDDNARRDRPGPRWGRD